MKALTTHNDETSKTSDEVTISLVKESLVVDREIKTTGEVTIVKSTETKQLDIPTKTVNTVYREERIPKNIVIDEVPEIRTEGQVTIIPVVREEAVVVTRLILVEEIHLTKEITETPTNIPVTLKEDRITIERR